MYSDLAEYNFRCDLPRADVFYGRRNRQFFRNQRLVLVMTFRSRVDGDDQRRGEVIEVRRGIPAIFARDVRDSTMISTIIGSRETACASLHETDGEAPLLRGDRRDLDAERFCRLVSAK